MEIEWVPQKGLVGQAKNEEIAMRGAVLKSGGDGGEFSGWHVGCCGVGCGGVVEEGSGDGEWERGGGGGESWSCGGCREGGGGEDSDSESYGKGSDYEE